VRDRRQRQGSRTERDRQRDAPQAAAAHAQPLAARANHDVLHQGRTSGAASYLPAAAEALLHPGCASRSAPQPAAEPRRAPPRRASLRSTRRSPGRTLPLPAPSCNPGSTTEQPDAPARSPTAKRMPLPSAIHVSAPASSCAASSASRVWPMAARSSNSPPPGLWRSALARGSRRGAGAPRWPRTRASRRRAEAGAMELEPHLTDDSGVRPIPAQTRLARHWFAAGPSSCSIDNGPREHGCRRLSPRLE
jgi:hypothetical protein